MNKSQLRKTIIGIYSYTKMNLILKEILLPFMETHNELCKKHKVPAHDSLEKRRFSISDFIVPFFEKKELFLTLIATFPDNVRALIEDLMWNKFYNNKEIKDKFNINIIRSDYKPHEYSYDFHSFINPYLLLFQIEKLGSNGFVFGFDDELRGHLSLFFEQPAPKELQIAGKNEIDPSYILFDKSQAAFTELPVLYSFFTQGQINLNASNKPSITSLNKMRKVCNIEEFYNIKEVDKALSNIRTNLLIEILFEDSITNQYFDSMPTHEFIKHAYLHFVEGYHEAERLLPHIKGFKYIDEFSINNNVNNKLHQLLLEVPKDKWVSVESILEKVIFEGQKFDIVKVKEAYYHLYISVKQAYDTKMFVNKMNYDEIMVKPLIKAFFMFCASMGVLDVYYEVPQSYLGGYGDEKSIFPYEGIKYIRLTDLGAYVTGQSTDYKVPKMEEASVTLDEENLLIHYDSENKALLGMVESISRPAGNHLFKVDFATVLGRCNNYQEINAQIRTFEKLLSNNPPQIWKDFFAALKEKSYKFVNQNDEYLIYSLPDNKELMNLFAKDNYLKQHIIRAEYYHVLIRVKSLPAVKKHLKKSGFLIEFE